MTIEQADKIDGMGIDSSNDELVLLISDHLSWDDEQTHIASLENKLAGYLNFLKTGQHLESVPAAKGLSVRVKLVHEHSPPRSALSIFQTVAAQLETMDIRFSHQPLTVSY
jgi:hypothetical protein